MRRLGLVIAAGLALWAPARAQDHHHMAELAPPGPVALQVGQVVFANSGAPAAQAPFLAGLALLHNFEYPRAAEAFRQAQAADPGFAMAYWGEAMTYNHPVWMEQDADAARAALTKLAPTPEARLAKAGTAREGAYLVAVEVLYGVGSKDQRDDRYADAMAALHASYPDDVDATAFYALALLGTSHEGRDVPTYMRSAALLEDVYPTHPQHPGVLHYMIHSYDDPVHAPLGLRAARRYGAVAPDAPHALHMTSHIFIAMGMWDEVIQANLDSIRALNGLRAARKLGPRPCGHASSWLMYGYLQERRLAEARDLLAACRASAVEELAKAGPAALDPDRSDVGSAVYMRAMQTAETGRWDPGEDLALPPGRYASSSFYAAYGEALAGTAPGDAARLRSAAARMADLHGAMLAEIAAANPSRSVYRDSAQAALDEVANLVRIRGGETEAGLAGLRATAEADAATPMEFGPPLLTKPAYELLGDELLRAGRPAEALAAYRAALARAPGRTASLEGLLKAQQSVGETTGAAATRAELARYPRGAK